MPLYMVEYPVSAYWMSCCHIGLFSRGARGETRQIKTTLTYLGRGVLHNYKFGFIECIRTS